VTTLGLTLKAFCILLVAIIACDDNDDAYDDNDVHDSDYYYYDDVVDDTCSKVRKIKINYNCHKIYSSYNSVRG
jgi:hypothetical protein